MYLRVVAIVNHTNCGDHFLIYTNMESCCTSETNTVTCPLYLSKNKYTRKVMHEGDQKIKVDGSLQGQQDETVGKPQDETVGKPHWYY